MFFAVGIYLFYMLDLQGEQNVRDLKQCDLYINVISRKWNCDAFKAEVDRILRYKCYDWEHNTCRWTNETGKSMTTCVYPKTLDY